MVVAEVDGAVSGEARGVEPVEPTPPASFSTCWEAPSSQPHSFFSSLEAQPAAGGGVEVVAVPLLAPQGGLYCGFRPGDIRGSVLSHSQSLPGQPCYLSYFCVYPNSPFTGLVTGLSLVLTSL